MTHTVTNQPPPLDVGNAYQANRPLRDAVDRYGAGWADDDLSRLGVVSASPEAAEWGRMAEANRPVLHTHDRYGHRIDRVEYHPAYHELMRTAVGHGLHAAPWVDPQRGSHVARAAKFIVWTPVDYGHSCPISMTHAVVPALRHAPELAAEWEPRLVGLDYDRTDGPAADKTGAIAGMAMTEKQGGSDVRTNTTTAVPNGDGSYAITGHKWFCSAPMSDLFLTLAQAPGGLTCFLMPRWLPDGTRNPIRVMRLKDKLGDRSNASSEIEMDGVVGWRVGDEGAGVKTIVEMVNRTRLDCALGAAAQMRHGIVEAVHHSRYRGAFGKDLVEQPLMRRVLADLALESEAATAAAMCLADALDRGDHLLARMLTPVVKYWLTKRTPGHAAEALEVLGGAGYVEESGMPRLFRQSPVNGIWEGSGNVICLDVLRVMRSAPEAVEAFFAEVDAATGTNAAFDVAAARARDDLVGVDESTARRFVERVAILLQASLLLRHAPAGIGDAFIAARVSEPGLAYGAAATDAPTDLLLDRALPT
ncbi:MAG: acyl-CoA dehydrogenase family protein [Acidimicrobiia bacterium]